MAGVGMIVTGFLIVFMTFRANTFTSATITIEDGQTVVDLGPYAFVRHPMYSGALVIILGIAPALGLWLALLPAIALVPLVMIRALREEALLNVHLPGYRNYGTRVRFRLVPLIW
jgi:protein-S-isoprenylcysteine O-methyltransferase Ste14